MQLRLVALFLGMVPLTLATSARAAPVPPPSGSLDQLAVDFAGKLGPALEGHPVPTLALLLQVRQPPGLFSTGQQRLSKVLAQLAVTQLRALKFRLLKLAPAHQSAAAVQKRGLQGGFALTLVVHVVQSGNFLHLRARLYDTNVTLWGKLKGRGARLLTHLHASVPIDGAIRSYLARPPKSAVTCAGQWRPLGKHSYWGVALGDVDGDGRSELVLLRPDALEIRRWSVVYQRFDSVATVAFTGPLAQVKPRFVVGALAVGDLDGDRREDILARSSDRATAVLVSYKRGVYAVRRRLGGYPLGIARLGGQPRVAVGYPMPGRAELNGRAVSWQPAYRARMTMPMVYHNLRLARTKLARGASGHVYAVVDDKAQLTVRHLPGGRLIQRLNGVGRALALSDLTGDGRPELITSTPKAFGSSDALEVRRLGQAARVCRVAGFDGSVTAVTAGDVRLDGVRRIVAVVWNARRRRSYLLVVR
ncbi:MAG: VCBS repeat-containing protein [bacterium]